MDLSASLIGYILGVPTGLALVWLLARAIVRTFWIERPHGLIYGDVVTLPPEMLATRETRGGGAGRINTGRQTRTNDVRTRHVGSATK